MYLQSNGSDHQIFVCLFRPGDHLAPRDTHTPPSVILKGRVTASAAAENGMFLRPGQILVESILVPGRASVTPARFTYDFLYFSQEQRDARTRACAVLQDHLTALLGPEAARPGETAADLVPFVIIGVKDAFASCYHFTDIGLQGALYLCYENLVAGQSEFEHADIDDLLRRAYPRLRRCHELLNHDCTFSRWQAEFELERKFTFSGVPDTWRLNQDLYRNVLTGRIPGFVPELGLEFQVYDYESHVFEVTGPASEAGYISFIPQSDGKMTIKRKWFVENSELRRETITGHQNIHFLDIDSHVRTMTDGQVKKLSAFRRKRFDAHMESLSTGHIFGIYFDICRIVGDDSTVMSQCEVEYCRSRTLFDLKDVYGEFEFLADYTRGFLEEHGVAYEHNLYSKLDFVRDHCTAAAL